MYRKYFQLKTVLTRIFQWKNPASLRLRTAKGLLIFFKKRKCFTNPKQFYVGVKPVAALNCKMWD